MNYSVHYLVNNLVNIVSVNSELTYQNMFDISVYYQRQRKSEKNPQLTSFSWRVFAIFA